MSARNNDPWTVQKRFGFGDNDLKTSLHDEIMFWLDDNSKKVLTDCFEIDFSQNWTKKELELGRDNYQKRINDNRWDNRYFCNHFKSIDFSTFELPSKIPEKIELTYEYVIQNKNYTIGFIDVLVTIEMPELWVTVENGLECQYSKPYHYGIEIKGEIESFGQLLRQIRLYQQYLSIPFGVVSPDNQFEKMLKNQGVGFSQYQK